MQNKSEKTIVGYTTGVFDLFHIGHLNILKKAKQACDYLIVGVTSDTLVNSRKNKKPVIPFQERMEILKAIRYVDEVVEQSDMDKFTTWKKLQFNVMFVGDDWKGSRRWNKYEKELNTVGVKIVYFPYTRNTSSTLLKATLEELQK
ncbi:MAG: adenylyltransferase/cytidyltransferase family protein [Patescibacteria group bacterium]